MSDESKKSSNSHLAAGAPDDGPGDSRAESDPTPEADGPEPELGSFKSPRERRAQRKREREKPRTRRGPLDAWLEWLMFAVVLGSVLAVGTVHVPTLVVVGTFGIAAGVLAMVVYRKDMGNWPVTLPAAGVLALTAWTAIQAIPLPAGLVAALAPSNAEVWAHALDPLGLPGPSWHPISLDPGATWVEVLKGFTYASMILASSVVAYRRSATFGVATVFVSALAAGWLTIAHGLAGMTKVFGIYEPVYFNSPWQMGPLLNSNHLAGYLNLGAMCGLGILLMRHTRIPRWVSGLGVAALLALSVLAASRGAVVLLPVGLAVVVLLMRSRSRRARSEVVSNRWLNILTGAAVAGGLALAALGITTKQMKALIDEDLSKLSIMEWAGPLVADHPWFGVGRGAFETTYQAYRPNQGHMLWTHPENLAMQWAAEWGVPVAIVAGIFFAWLIRPSRMGATRSGVAAGAVAGIVILVLQNWVDFSLELPGVTIAVVVLIGSCWGDTRRRGVGRWDREPSRMTKIFERVGVGLGRGASRSSTSTSTSTSTRWGGVVGFGAIGIFVVVVAGVKGQPTPLQDRMAFHEMTQDGRLPASKFDPLVRAAMLRHPAEPFLPLVGAERAWRVRDADPIPYLQRVFARSMRYGRAHLLLAEILFARGAKNQALMELKYAARDEPRLVNSSVALAVRFTQDQDDLMRMVPQGQEGAAVLDTLGAWMHRRNPEAGKHFDKLALERDPSRVAPRTRRITDLVEALRKEDVPGCVTEDERRACAETIEEHIVQIERREPDTSRAARLRAEALVALGKVDEADQLLARTCDHVTDRYVCLRARVPLLRKLERGEELDELLDQVAAEGCRSGKECAQVYVWVGGVQRGRKNLGAAVNAYRKATRHDPRNVGAWVALGDAASAMGTHAQAAYAYEQAMRLQPGEGLRKKLDEARRLATGSLLRR